ncbi:MAG TPA: cyclic nucleotide-binding and patatin-like phospholipase domain-containing protein [Longimicrobium sp.]|jgi:predicted acylesterase/phospholipase RssA/CRP-like cAMP-binding protein|nr:cyclic nucleotide-binding and patatin-like phospholipase domain-containing protein [Longimicrobium sp.]
MQSSSPTRADLTAAVRAAPLFAALDASALDALASCAVVVPLADGEDAFADGTPDGLLLVLEGSVDAVEDGGGALRWMGAGEVFDRQLTLAGVARRVLVRGAGAATLARIPCDVADALEALDPAFAAAMTRMHARQLLCRLAPVLGTLDARLLDELERAADWVHLVRGDMLFEQGAPATGLYFVVSGRLLVERVERDGTVRPIGEAGRGQSLGEMAFFSGAPRSARASALRDTVLVEFTNDEFDALVANRPQLMRHVAAGLVERLNRANTSASAAQVTNLAVLRASPGAPVAAFCERLAEALSRMGPVLRLSAATVDAFMGEPGIAQAGEESPESARLLAWIEAREASHRFVVLEADAEATPWTRRCLHQADRVLLVAHADEDPAPTAAERELLGHPRRVTDARQALVLVHPEGTHRLPHGTRRWIDARAVDAHFHLRWGSGEDMGRLARHLAGRAVGLALGGGGARGFAHIGMVRALREGGVPIDLIGGTSMGASIAAQIAMGWSPEHVVNVNRRIWVKIRPHKEYTIPLISIIGTRGSDKVGKMLYGDTQIEDLWTPFFCVSSNLSTAEMMVHRRGSLLWAATASASLPGAAQPVLLDGQLLCDGALLNNLPADVARRLGCGIVIAAEVSVEEDAQFCCERIPRVGELLRDRLFRRRKIRFPSLMELALRASLLHSASSEREALDSADFTLRPPIEGFGLMDFYGLDRLVEVGYQHARVEVAKWVASGALDGLAVDFAAASG